MPGNPKVLFVDDEDSIRLTLPPVLQSHGFDVTTAASVADALALIMQSPFDVLIADLNIGRPGDGFTVISAMRSTQPNALRFILTGYPDFDTAMEAIRQEVHEYLIKPADTDALVENIRTRLGKSAPAPAKVERKRLAQVIRENRESIIKRWGELIKADPALSSVANPVTGTNLSEWLDVVLVVAEERGTTADAISVGRREILRGNQKLPVPLLVRLTRLLQVAIGDCTQKNLLSIDVSYLVPDLVRVFAAIQTVLEEATRPATATAEPARNARSGKGKRR